jgi:hypothetical protein
MKQFPCPRLKAFRKMFPLLQKSEIQELEIKQLLFEKSYEQQGNIVFDTYLLYAARPIITP